MRQEGVELNLSIVVDARLRPNHSTEVVQSVLMSICKSDFPFRLTHMSGAQYLLLLPPGADRHRFLLKFGKPLQDLGYVTYPWSAAINGYPLRLKYKVWIELRNMSPNTWNVNYLIPAISTFGIVLEHCSMNKVSTLERMRAVIVVTDLECIPKAIIMWVRGIGRKIQLVVHSWLEEPLPLLPTLDTTPTQAFFEKVRADNVKAVTGYGTGVEGKEVVAVEYNVILAIWEKMPAGPEKDSLKETLSATPYFAEYQKNKDQAVTPEATAQPPKAGPTGSAQATKPGFSAKEKGKWVPLDRSISRGNGQDAESNRGPFTNNSVTETSHATGTVTGTTAPHAMGTVPGTATPYATGTLLTDTTPTPAPSDFDTTPTPAQIFQNQPTASPPNQIHKAQSPISLSKPINATPTQISDPPQITNPPKPNTPTGQNQVINNEPIEEIEEEVAGEFENEPVEEEPMEETEEEPVEEIGTEPVEEEPMEEAEEEPVEEIEAEPADGAGTEILNSDPARQLDFEEDYYLEDEQANQASPVLEEDEYDSNWDDYGHDSPTGIITPPGEYGDNIDMMILEAEFAMDNQNMDPQPAIIGENHEYQEGMEDEPDHQEMQEEPPLIDDEPLPPNLRRSARISKRGNPKTYHTRRSKVPRAARRGAAPKGKISETELVSALQVEALVAQPLQEEIMAQVHNYCGYQMGNQGAGPSSDTGGQQQQEYGNESVLGAMDYSSDSMTDDEEEDGADLGQD